MADKKPAESNKAAVKKAEEKKLANFAANVKRFFKEVKGEAKKVVWPAKKQVINNTLVVLGMMLISGLCIWGLDSILALIVNTFLRQA